MPRLKRTQYWVLDNILARVPLHDAAHGFAAQRSILTNARNHVGRDVVINLDLKDFFPTLTYARVKGLFEALGYAEAVAIPLALLWTEPMVDEVALDGERHFVADGPRLLPQGAPTSPAITNLIWAGRQALRLRQGRDPVAARLRPFRRDGRFGKRHALLQRAQRLAAQYGPVPSARRPTRAAFRNAAAAGQTPPGRQWNPAERPPPPPDPVLVALARQDEKKRTAQARVAAPGPSRMPNVPPPPVSVTRVVGSQAAPPSAPSGKRQPWFVTALVIVAALAVLLLPGGPAIAGAMLFLYFSRWWKR
ncbi:hypothetical protein ACE10Z_21005 [Bradyrhizobium sp. Pha-3]|uniref:hypothetical protein n=1 Tax=Bradyrhizobium sp. Pha-3 TaxID=208375 RepID=UPI0035D4DC5C